MTSIRPGSTTQPSRDHKAVCAAASRKVRRRVASGPIDTRTKPRSSATGRATGASGSRIQGFTTSSAVRMPQFVSSSPTRSSRPGRPVRSRPDRRTAPNSRSECTTGRGQSEQRPHARVAIAGGVLGQVRVGGAACRQMRTGRHAPLRREHARPPRRPAAGGSDRSRPPASARLRRSRSPCPYRCWREWRAPRPATASPRRRARSAQARRFSRSPPALDSPSARGATGGPVRHCQWTALHPDR